jgi:TRAP-type mannitol/chloroaromatic compound transport system permease small subunit
MAETTEETTGAPHVARRSTRIARAWNGFVDGLGAAGTAMIGVLMVMICADVAVRNITGGSLPMIAEAGAITLVTMVYLQLATTIRHDRLARADLFFAGFRRRFPRGGAILAAVYDLTAAGALGVIAWSTITILERDITRGEYIGVTGIATLPTWPFRAAILLGLTVATIQCLVMLVSRFRDAGRGEAT